MDWTGGTRRRFTAGRNNANVLKQKQHFAKVRATLDHTPSSQRTFGPNFLPLTAAKRRVDHSHHGRGQSRHNQYRVHRSSPSGSQRGEKTSAAVQPARGKPRSAYVWGRSVVSVSSGMSSSSGRSSRNEQASVHGSSKLQQPVKPLQGTTAKAFQLSADRRRLLARRDWLGLSATRPLHMAFRSSGDKDHIAKRRKVEKSTHRAIPAGRRLLTPLFEERLVRPDHVMSGALPQGSIRIKIGTDTFASQTQPSRRSQTPANTSMRQPSTEFGPLSEESMLLGADGDSFEALNVAMSPKVYVEPTSDHVESYSRSAINTPSLQRIPGSPEMPLLTGELHTRQVSPSPANHCPAKDPGPSAPSLATTGGLQASPDAQQGEVEGVHGPISRASGSPMRFSRAAAYNDSALQLGDFAPELAQDEHNDVIWRGLLNIQHQTSSHASLAAVRSSSLHDTPSSNSHRPVLCEKDIRDEEDGLLLSTPVGAGTQGAPLTQATVASMAQSTAWISPSASLKQITKLAKQPAQIGNKVEFDEDENALWRDFIIGSGDDDSESSQRPATAASDDGGMTSCGLTTPETRSFAVSELGNSAEATQGGALMSARTLSRHSATDTRQRNSDRSLKGRDIFGLSQISLNPPADLGHDGEIEDTTSPPRVKRRPTNIDTGPARIQKAKQYRLPKAEPVTSAFKANETKPSIRRKTRVAKPHDVYDLVDSDGRSLA